MNELTQDEWKQLSDEVRSAARRVVLSWPEIIEADDLGQDMLIKLLESPGYTRQALALDTALRMSFFIKMGHQVASNQQVDYEQFHGNHLYGAEEVREYLDKNFLTEGSPSHFKEELFDMKEGLEALRVAKSPYFAEIVNRWVHDIRPDRLDKAAHKRITRAVESLTRHMNRMGKDRRNNHEGPGSRKVGVQPDPAEIIGDNVGGWVA